MVSLDRCNESCNTIDDLLIRTCVPNKTKVVSFNVFNMLIRINSSKTLTKHMPCDCECKSNGRKCNSNQKWNSNKH